MRHLRKLKVEGRLGLRSSSERFRAGYTFCAGEISRYLTSPPAAAGLDLTVSARLLHHLSVCMRNMETGPAVPPLPVSPPPPPILSPSELSARSEALKFSLSQSGPGDLVQVGSDREDDKAWRPW